jgi:hypothetical protein
MLVTELEDSDVGADAGIASKRSDAAVAALVGRDPSEA